MRHIDLMPINTIVRINLSLIILLATSLNPLTASIVELEPQPKTVASKVKSLVSKPYRLAAHYLPVLEKALTQVRVPFKAKKLRVERYIYDSSLESSPSEKLIADVDIKKKGMLGQLITAKGKLNDMDLKYKNHFKFSITGKGTMDVESSLAGEEFIKLRISANKRKATTDVAGAVMGKEVQYFSDESTTEGFIAEHPYKVSFNSIKNKKGELVQIITKGNIGDYAITGEGHRISENQYAIEEHYGPLLIKTVITVLG